MNKKTHSEDTVQDEVVPEVAAAPPALHSALTGGALLGSLGLFIWTLIAGSWASAFASGVLCIAFAYGTAEIMTTSIRLANDHLVVRDRVLRLRSIPVKRVARITFVPSEMFRVQTADGAQIDFPARAKGITGVCRELLKAATAHHDVEFCGNLSDLGGQSETD